MLHVLPMIVWSAMSLSVTGGILIPLMTRAMNNSYNPILGDRQNEIALFTMTFLGVGEIVGGPLTGLIRDKCGNRVAYFFVITLIIGSVILVAVFNRKNNYDKGQWAFPMCFVWGLMDSGVNTL